MVLRASPARLVKDTIGIVRSRRSTTEHFKLEPACLTADGP
jgi:hypothetical protein